MLFWISKEKKTLKTNKNNCFDAFFLDSTNSQFSKQIKNKNQWACKQKKQCEQKIQHFNLFNAKKANK